MSRGLVAVLLVGLGCSGSHVGADTGVADAGVDARRLGSHTATYIPFPDAIGLERAHVTHAMFSGTSSSTSVLARDREGAFLADYTTGRIDLRFDFGFVPLDAVPVGRTTAVASSPGGGARVEAPFARSHVEALPGTELVHLAAVESCVEGEACIAADAEAFVSVRRREITVHRRGSGAFDDLVRYDASVLDTLSALPLFAADAASPDGPTLVAFSDPSTRASNLGFIDAGEVAQATPWDSALEISSLVCRGWVCAVLAVGASPFGSIVLFYRFEGGDLRSEGGVAVAGDGVPISTLTLFQRADGGVQIANLTGADLEVVHLGARGGGMEIIPNDVFLGPECSRAVHPSWATTTSVLMACPGEGTLVLVSGLWTPPD